MAPPKQKPGLSKQDYQTPTVFLDATRKLLDIENFTLDLAASEENAVCGSFYDEVYDSLKREGDWVTQVGCEAWCNPPYSHIAPWVEKAYRESLLGATIAMLVPASVGSNWWRDWVHNKAVVVLLNGRITFVGHTAGYPKDCALLLYDKQDTHGIAPFYAIWSWMK